MNEQRTAVTSDSEQTQTSARSADASKDASQRSARLLSLDAFRGLTMVAMTLVNNPGSWSHVYPPLRHAEWNGWTITDLVFPFFIFIVGVAIPYALGKRFEKDSRRAIYFKIFRRAAMLFF